MSNLLIETTLLNTFLDDDSWAYVKAGKDFVRKKARDLNKGDLVVIKNEAIHKTLDEIIPILKQSIRYQIAEETIHEKNCNNEYIPKLRTLLLEGLADSETPQLQEKILKEGIDFTQKEYAEFRKTICNIVDIGEDAVNSWLNGVTLAPANWENFQKLISINPAFEEIYQSYQKDSGYYSNYQLYVGSRRTIMSYLAKRTGKNKKIETKRKSEEEKQEQKSTERKEGVYTDEIELVVSHFIKEIDDTYSAARITKIKKVEEKIQNGRKIIGRNGHKPEANLKKAIITEELPELKLKDMEQLKNNHYIITNALCDIFNRYITKKIEKEIDVIETRGSSTTKESIRYQLYAGLSSYLYTKLITIAPAEKKISNHNFSSVYDNPKYSKKDIEDALEQYHQEFREDLANNKIDQLLKLEPNTISHIIDYLNESRNALPKTYFETQLLSLNITLINAQIQNESNRKKRKEYQNEIKENERKHKIASKYLIENYNINIEDRKLFFYNFYQYQKGLQRLEQLNDNEDNSVLLESKRLYESQGYKFYKRIEVVNILKELKIPSAIRIYHPKTFI